MDFLEKVDDELEKGGHIKLGNHLRFMVLDQTKDAKALASQPIAH